MISTDRVTAKRVRLIRGIMRYSLVVRLPTVIALATCATLGSLAVSGPASATVARVTCSKVVGAGTARHPAIASGCTDVAKTGGTGKIVAKFPNVGRPPGIWTITWAGKHGTTRVSFRWKSPKKNACPKGWLEAIDTGKITGGTGPAHTVIPKGQTMSARGCGNPRTGASALLKGTKLIL